MPRVPAAALALGLACSSSNEEPSARPRDSAASPAAPAPTDDSEVEEDTTNLVHVEVLLAAEDELAVRYQIKPGWHLYWENPGDAGLATDAAFEGPPGVTFEPLRYPAPERFVSPGDVHSYGYEHETVLFARFALPDPPPEHSKVVAHATWLACKSSCIRGKADAHIEIATATPADDTLLVDHREKLPRPGSELPGRPAWAATETGRALTVSIAGGELVEFYPLLTEPARLERTDVTSDRLQLHYRVAASDLARVRGPQGVVVIRNPDRSRSYFRLETPWPTT